MIRSILTGGLGNQMFEYAAAKALALKLGKELTLDLYALNKKTKGVKRDFELDIFDISPTISSSWKTKLLVKIFPFVDRNRSFFKKTFNYFRDRSAIVYCPKFENLRGNVILHGHFQNENYFKTYENIIRQEFTFKQDLDEKNLQLADKMTQTESVAVHIRRGDYLTDSNFALCPKEYYQEAMNEIKQRVEKPFFFVFSQDFDWINENLTFDKEQVLFVDWNKGKDSYRDMQLMSLCKHNIIANSSFSWWAAWLNNHPKKMVFAPKQWFGKEERNKDLVNFYPQGWKMI